MSKQVVVIDHGVGNVFAVCNALLRIGASPILSTDPSSISTAERVILPGVGAFSKVMENLRIQGLDDAIANFIDTGRPFLGICVGMQVLMEHSKEFGEHVGLGYIKGTVEKIPALSVNGKCLKTPRIGWSEITARYNFFIEEPFSFHFSYNFFYFVHSFACKPCSEERILATSNYHGHEIPAIIGRNNILGVQFHPERSGPAGLRFLNEYLRKD